MPKKDGVVKTYSFSHVTISQIEELCSFYMLKPTSLIEFLVNKEYFKEVSNGRRKKRKED